MTGFEDRVRSGLGQAAEEYEPSPRLRREVDRRVRRHRRSRIATGAVGAVGALIFVAGLGVLLATDDEGNQNESTAATTTPIAIDSAAARQAVTSLLEELNRLRVHRTEPVLLEEVSPTLRALHANASPGVQAAIEERIGFENDLYPLSIDAGTAYVESSTSVEIESETRQPDGSLVIVLTERREFTIENGVRFPSIGMIPHRFEVGSDIQGRPRIEDWHETTLLED